MSDLITCRKKAFPAKYIFMLHSIPFALSSTLTYFSTIVLKNFYYNAVKKRLESQTRDFTWISNVKVNFPGRDECCFS